MESMIRYAQASRCLRRSFIQYFGQKAAPSCENCSVCLSAKYRNRTTFGGAKKAVSPKQKVDLSAISVGMEVYHRTFGTGRIVSISDHLMKIAFEHSIKNFEYPGALERAYLTTSEKEDKRRG